MVSGGSNVVDGDMNGAPHSAARALRQLGLLSDSGATVALVVKKSRRDNSKIPCTPSVSH